MESVLKHCLSDIESLVNDQADFIAQTQLPSGAIPWFTGGITDPWDHIEGAIALDLANRHEEAVKAYRWSRNIQNDDGSWYFSYQNDIPQDKTRDTNFASYIATGVWLHYKSTNTMKFLTEMWPTVEKGLNFALRLQQPTGEILYALSPQDTTWPGAILTSNCCIWKSMENGINIAQALDIPKPEWQEASEKLLTAIKEHPELFDKMGENNRRYAMNWFYPVLTGIINGEEARERFEKEWSDFVIDGWGCRVAADEDVTAVAETSELIIALALAGEYEKGNQLLNWTLQLRDDKPGFCRGIKLPEQEPCPPDEERATWTSAALIMAIAALAKA